MPADSHIPFCYIIIVTESGLLLLLLLLLPLRLFLLSMSMSIFFLSVCVNESFWIDICLCIYLCLCHCVRVSVCSSVQMNPGFLFVLFRVLRELFFLVLGYTFKLLGNKV